MKLEQSFPNNFTFINGDGTKFQFDKNEENQYYIFDSIESSILTNQAVFLHTSSSSAFEWNALLTLPSDPTISQKQIIEEIIKEYNRFAKFTTKGTGQFFYPFKGSELNFSDFDYPQLIYYSNIPFFSLCFFSVPCDIEDEHLQSFCLVNEDSIMEAFQTGKLHDSIVGYVSLASKQFKLWLPSKLSFYQRCILFNNIIPGENLIQKMYVYASEPYALLNEFTQPNIYLKVNFQTNPEPTVTLRRQL